MVTKSFLILSIQKSKCQLNFAQEKLKINATAMPLIMNISGITEVYSGLPPQVHMSVT